MNAILQTQLDRVEAALNTLTDSITSYNPSLQATQELLAADSDLSEEIDRLTTHQHNHRHLQSLHSTAAFLADRLTSTLTMLAETRTSIITAAPSAPIPKEESSKDNNNDDHFSSASRRLVPHAQLLAYAQNTSRFAAPPSLVPAGTIDLPSTATVDEAGALSSGLAKAASSSSPAAESSAGTGRRRKEINPGLSLLDATERAWLDPVTQAPFVPWPSEEMVARSALARVQGWSGAASEEAPAGAGDAAKGEAEGNQGVEEAQEVGERARSDAGRREQAGTTERASEKEREQERETEKPKVFMGLDLYDPDEE